MEGNSSNDNVLDLCVAKWRGDPRAEEMLSALLWMTDDEKDFVLIAVRTMAHKHTDEGKEQLRQLYLRDMRENYGYCSHCNALIRTSYVKGNDELLGRLIFRCDVCGENDLPLAEEADWQGIDYLSDPSHRVYPCQGEPRRRLKSVKKNKAAPRLAVVDAG